MTPLVPRTHFLAHVLLAAVGLPLALVARLEQPRCVHFTDTKLVIKDVEAALVLFQTEKDGCPASLATFIEQKILVKVPLDSWGQPLRFVCPGAHNPYGADIVSAGRDRIFGTADDIRSWEL
jgi:hypothetical protein